MVPARSQAQRFEALARANEVRSHRAAAKRRLKDGDVSARELLLSGDERLGSWRVYDVLMALPKVGRVKANKTLARVRVSPSKTLGGLTERQRLELLALLPR